MKRTARELAIGIGGFLLYCVILIAAMAAAAVVLSFLHDHL